MEVVAAASPALAAADATSKPRIHSPRRPGAAIPSSRLTFDGRKILRRSIIELESLGEGTFGRVCRCSIPGAAGGDTIAMKLVETQLADVIEDAKRELDIMSQLRGVSPFVVHGRGGGCISDQQVVILLDFMQGGNLLSRIQQQPLDEDSTRFYAASIIMGLDALHSRHILHRDIKPDNVLIDGRGYVKLADLGFAKQVQDIECTSWHSVVGTAEYFPPEVARVTEEDANLQGAEYSKGLDIWGLGVTLYNCLTGRRPFLPEGMDDLDTEVEDEDAIYKSIIGYVGAAGAVGRAVALWGRRGRGASSQFSPEARSFVEELLAPEPAERLGMGARGYAEMRRHVWFDGFDWSALRNGTMSAPREPGSQNSASPEKPKAKTAAATKSATSKAMLDALAQLQQRTGRDGRMVASLFIELPDKAMYPDYYKIIRNPVCFSTIQQRVETSWYKDWPNFEKDVLLIFANARQYNLPGSQVCLDADALEKAYRALVAKMHTTTKKSTTRPVPDKKPKQPQRKQARLKAMLGAWSVLSSCTANDGRQLAKHFLRLPSKKTYADYYKIVKVPICLHMIKEKIKRAHYRSWAAFENDVLRMLRNARKYNLPGSQICLDTDALERAYRTYVAKVAKELKGAAQPIAKKKKQQVRSAGKQTASEAMLGAWQALAMLIGDDGRWLAGAFMELPDQLLYAEYFDKIKVPMCLNSIKEKVEGDSYAGWRAFEKDVLRVFDNARQFNDRSSQIAQDADIMEASFREYGKSLPSDVKTAKISAKRKKSSLSSKQSPAEAMQGALTALDALVADDERWLAGAFTDLPDRLFYPEYFDQIKAPMCLSRIKEKVGCGAYAGWRAFEKDMLLIFDNARRFNDRGSQIAQDADTMEASFREYGKSLPSDVKTAKIVNRSMSMGSPEKIAMFKVWQQLCSQTGAKGRYLAKAFRELPDRAMYPNYFDIIRQPMCLSIIKEKLDQSSYKDWAAFEKDTLLIFANARQYNLPGSQVCLDADALEKAYHGYSVRDQRPSSALHDCKERSIESSGSRMQAAWAHLCGYTSVDGRYLAKAFRELPDRAMYPNYFDIIRQPMCLSVIKEKLDQSSYKDWAAFEKDILLIFANARQYNLPGSQVCLDADALEKAYQGLRASDPSASALRSTSDVPAIDAHVKIRMQNIWQAVVDCEDTSGRTRSTLFMVKPSAIDYPDYYTIIERAIDLTTIRGRIESDAYATRLEFVSDMRLLFDNAQLYNMASSQVAIDAVALWELVEDWDCGREDDGTGRRRLRKRRRGQ